MSFDLDMARRCLQASADAYVVTPSVDSVLAHVHVKAGNDVVIVAFRGTANIRDWITDFECEPVDLWDGIKVHDGFWTAVQTVIRPLKDLLSGSITPPKLYLTGHSLGSALAMLCAWLLERGEFPVEGVYTFGGPRVGNGSFARVYNGEGARTKDEDEEEKTGLGERTWRFVNEEDIVPRVPGLLAGYRHAGQEVFFPSLGGAMRMNPPIWLKAINDLVGAYQEWKQGRFALLADHAVREYMGRLGCQGAEVAKI